MNYLRNKLIRAAKRRIYRVADKLYIALLLSNKEQKQKIYDFLDMKLYPLLLDIEDLEEYDED